MRAKALLVAVVLLLTTAVLGQREKLIKIDGDGDFHLGTKTVVADHILDTGMYRVTLSHVNGRDLVTFYEVPMKRFGKGMWPGARRELFRIGVRAQPGTAVKKTTLKVLKKGKVQLALELNFKGNAARYVLPEARIAEL